jgi:hypothetical protein
MVAKAARFGAEDVRGKRVEVIWIFSKGQWLPNKRIQLTTSAVMPAAGHPACQPRRS